MTHYDAQYQNPWQSQQPWQWGFANPPMSQFPGQMAGAAGQQGMGYGLGQAAFGQPYGQYGYGQQLGQPGGWGFGAQPAAWGQPQRPLSQQDVSEVVRQLVPLLPQVFAQAQP